MRLADDNLPENEWLESIASFICSKPPSKWRDSDDDLFHDEIPRLAQRFRKLEILNYRNDTKDKGKSVFISLTQDDGTEIEQVISIDTSAKTHTTELEKEIIRLINDSKKEGLSAITRILKNELTSVYKSNNNNKNKN